jgi:hypothetical protein
MDRAAAARQYARLVAHETAELILEAQQGRMTTRWLLGRRRVVPPLNRDGMPEKTPGRIDRGQRRET